MSPIIPNTSFNTSFPTNELLAAALEYAAMGWRVIPVHPDTKVPCDPHTLRNLSGWPALATDDPVEIRQWFEATRAGIGIATGRASEIVVIDEDSKPGKNGAEGLLHLQKVFGPLPSTLTAMTPSGGRHFVFRYPAGVDTMIKNATNLGRAGFGQDTHIDIRADGGQINVWPTERDGVRYEWTTPLADARIADLPQPWIDVLVGGERTRAPAGSATNSTVSEGSRNACLTSHLGSHRARGVDEEDLVAIGLEWNLQFCNPPLSEEEVERTARGLMRYQPNATAHTLTELGNANRFVAKYRDDVRFTKEAGWYVWNGCAWLRDEKKQDVTLLMATIGEDVRRELPARGEPEAVTKARRAWARKSENKTPIRAALELAASAVALRASVNDFDQDPDLLALKNGVIDLRTGAFREGRRSDMITVVAPVDYDPAASAPKWQAFLDRVLAADAEVIRAVQTMAGYFLTGLNCEHHVWVFHGHGRNGKGVFINTFRKLIGGLARTASRETFVLKQNAGIPNDLAALRGARVVVCDEFPMNARPNEELLKQVSGGDPVTGRFLFGEFFSYDPAFKVVLVSNNRVKWTTGNYAMHERLIEVPFSVTIPKAERDPRLPGKLWSERSGILNWAVAGAARYYSEGLAIPEKIRAATASAWKEVDTVLPFIQATVSASPGTVIAAGDLFERYRLWCLMSGGNRLDAAAFKSYLERDLGWAQRRTNKGQFWIDVTLNT